MSVAPMRAPALYVAGFLEQEAGGAVTPFTFRLPCPPTWDDRRPAAWAAERRARRAYFATLDALRTGAIDPVEEAKLGRLLQDIRSNDALGTIRHFQRILDYVRRTADRPTLPAPPVPLPAVVITAPTAPGAGAGAAVPTDADFAARYRWALDWLEARRFIVAGKELRLEWRTRQAGAGGKVARV